MKLNQALGSIEVVGMPAAIEAADVAVKAAEVTLIGTELTDGMGMVTVKVLGEVSAVKAAMDAARIAAGKVNKVVSVSIIPRPDPQLEGVVLTPGTIGFGSSADSIATGDTATLASMAVYAGSARAAELPVWTGGAEDDADRPVLTPDVHDANTAEVVSEPKRPRASSTKPVASAAKAKAAPAASETSDKPVKTTPGRAPRIPGV